MHATISHATRSAMLDRVAIHAAEQASTALTKWFGRNVRIHTDGFATCRLGTVTTMLNGGENPVVAVHTGMDGALSGHVLLAFPDHVAGELVAILTGMPCDDPAHLDELGKSAITETGNIVSSIFLNGLATTLGIKAQPTAPTFLYDMGAAILEQMVAEQLEQSAEILYVRAKFEIDSVHLDWWLYVLPSAESMQVMTALLH